MWSMIGYFEGIDSERGLERRCADSPSLREFLSLGEREPVPDADPLCGSTLAGPHLSPPRESAQRFSERSRLLACGHGMLAAG
jgi:hypothetical protein